MIAEIAHEAATEHGQGAISYVRTDLGLRRFKFVVNDSNLDQFWITNSDTKHDALKYRQQKEKQEQPI